jgi:hypothetical protein
MSEHDAHAALTATARMRMLAEPVEDAQLMTFSERQARAREGRAMHEAARGMGHARAMLNNPVYRNEEIAAGLRMPEWHIETATGAALDALAGIPQQPYGMTDEQVRQRFADRQVDARVADFRDGRCVHGESHFTCPVCGVKMGWRDNE